MTIRVLTAEDAFEVAHLIRSSGQSHVSHITEQKLVFWMKTEPYIQWFVWEQEGIQGAYWINWKPEPALNATSHSCHLGRAFWREVHPLDSTYRLFLESAKTEAILRGFRELLVPAVFTVGDAGFYVRLGGEKAQLADGPGGAWICFHLDG